MFSSAANNGIALDRKIRLDSLFIECSLLVSSVSILFAQLLYRLLRSCIVVFVNSREVSFHDWISGVAIHSSLYKYLRQRGDANHDSQQT